VVFGKASGFRPKIDPSILNGKNGFRLDGNGGWPVAGAGDVNGDGFDDVMVANPLASPHGLFSGSTYVVFGKASGFAATIDLSTLDGNNGFRLDGFGRKDQSGRSVAGAGDVNGDGVADLVIGAPRANPDGGVGAGSSYVVFGRAPHLTRTPHVSAEKQ
jgi:hypothetical protein